MRLTSPIRRLARHIKRVQLEIARQDLAWLEEHYLVELERRRRRVLALRRAVVVCDSDAIASRVERELKKEVLS